MSTKNLGTEAPAEEIIKFVVARPWYPHDPDQLCIYVYGCEIQTGTLDDAKEFLKYVKRRSGNAEHDYAIYKLTFTKLHT